MTDYAKLAQQLKPFILPWMRQGTTGSASTGGGGMAVHALNGPLHTGEITQAQASWAATQTALNAHAANPDAHHNAATAGSGITVAAGQVVNVALPLDLGEGPLNFGTSSAGGVGTGHTHRIMAASDVSAGAGISRLLASSAAGALTLRTLNAVAQVSSPVLTASGIMTLSPATYVALDDAKIFRSGTYASGWTGNGFRLDRGVFEAGKTTLELDNLTVRGRMQVYELLIQQIRAHNGSVAISDTGKVSAVSGSGPYTITTDPEHGFAVGDLIRAQRFTGNGVYQSNLQVTAVADTNNFTASLTSGTAPAVGMDFVRLGSTSNANRRGGVYITASDTNAPYLDVWDGVASFADWGSGSALRVRLGNLQGYYGYGSRVYGFAAGQSGAGGRALTVDSTNGIRFIENTVTRLALDTALGFRVMDPAGVARLHVDTDGNLRIKNSAGVDAISLLNDGGSYFTGRMQIGVLGEIVQGAGTLGTVGNWGQPWGSFTGLRIGREGSVGRIGGYNDGTLQWEGRTDGKFYFGAGNGVLDAAGAAFAVTSALTDNRGYRFTNGGVTVGGVWGWFNSQDNWDVVQVEARQNSNNYPVVRVRALGSDTYGGAVELIGTGGSRISTLKVQGGAGEQGLHFGTDLGPSFYAEPGRFTVRGTAPALHVGNADVTTGGCSIKIGSNRLSGSGNAFVDFVSDSATYTTYGFRILRNGADSPNGATQLLHRGTGALQIRTVEAADLRLETGSATRVTVEAGGNVDVANQLRAQLIRLDSSGVQSGVTGTTTFTNENYTGALGAGNGTPKMLGGTNRNNSAWLKVYVGTQVGWIPIWYDIS